MKVLWNKPEKSNCLLFEKLIKSDFRVLERSALDSGIKSPNDCAPLFPVPFFTLVEVLDSTKIILVNHEIELINNYDVVLDSFVVSLLLVSAYFEGNNRLNKRSRFV